MLGSIDGVSKVQGLTPPTQLVLILWNGGYALVVLGLGFCAIDVIIQGGQNVGCNILFPQGDLLEQVVRPVDIIIHNHEVVHSRFFGVSDLLERGGQSFGDRLVALCSATSEAGFERRKGGRGYEDVERV
jgi:hypothetical protein